LRHPKRHIIVLLLTIVMLVPTVHSASANNAKPHGVTYYTSNDTYPSYLHLLTPSDQALVEKAQADIERYRESNITITVVDESGKPMQDVMVAFNQTDHNFLFGFNDFQPFIFDSVELMRDAGFNLFVVTPYWVDTEVRPSEFSWTSLEMQRPLELRDKGFKIKVHPIVYYAQMNIPEYLRSAGKDEIRNATMVFLQALLREIPDADIFELSNEANLQENRAGMTVEEFVHLLKEVASMIRAASENTTITVNAFDAFGEWTTMKYDGQNNLKPYNWYKLLMDEGLDYDAIAIQFRPGIYGKLDPLAPPDSPPGVRNRAPELTEISESLNKIASLGKPIHITEFEVPSLQLPEMKKYDGLDWNETTQAAYAEGFYTLMFSKPSVDSVTWWCMNSAMPTRVDNIRPRPWERDQSSLHMLQSYYLLKDLITNRWSTKGIGYTDSNGRLEYRGFAGQYHLTVNHEGLRKQMMIHVPEGMNSSFKIRFDGSEVREEMRLENSRLSSQASALIQEVHRASQWCKGVNKAKSLELANLADNLTHLYDKGLYDEVIRIGTGVAENPLGFSMTGKLSDLTGLDPLATDTPGDTKAGSPAGTDLVAVYGFADAANLYLGIRVAGDSPSKNATFTAEIEVDYGRFQVSVVRNGTLGWVAEQPFGLGRIGTGCPYAFDEIVEMRVPLWLLKYPNTIYLSKLWIWLDTGKPGGVDFDEYSGQPIGIPNLNNFNASSILRIETTTAATSTATPSTEPTASGLEGSISYIAVICGFVILGVVAVYIKTLRSRRRNLRDA
jgi:GH35 family endo-1,4-beta-xylanase